LNVIRSFTNVGHPHVFTFSTVYKDGKVCISILHPPGSDPNEYEKASERWLPVHTVESILVSVISMLASPNDESAANLDAAKEWRDENDVFRKKVRNSVRRATEDM
jgi:ubiquitin-conjugating enzyme E2 G1